MGSIADKLSYLNTTKQDIKTALQAQNSNVTDTDTFRSYADKIKELNINYGENWKPQSDWWDIKKIVEEDTENYPAKVGILLSDNYYTDVHFSQLFFNADKVVFSDGQTITKISDYTIGLTGAKPCKLGYNTYYMIIYLKNTNFQLGYSSFSDFFTKGLKWIYMKNVTNVQTNSGTQIGNCFEFEAWQSNIPFTISTNSGLMIQQAFMLQELPTLQEYYTTNDFQTNYLFNIVYAPRLKKEQYKKFFGANVHNQVSVLQDLQQIRFAFLKETIDLESDFGVDFNYVRNYNIIEGPDTIQKLDFNNVTTNPNSIFGVKNVNVITNIKSSNSMFRANRINDRTAILNHDTLVRVINALYDYSTAGGSYTLSLEAYNLAKLTDEEIAVGTAKGRVIN